MSLNWLINRFQWRRSRRVVLLISTLHSREKTKLLDESTEASSTDMMPAQEHRLSFVIQYKFNFIDYIIYNRWIDESAKYLTPLVAVQFDFSSSDHQNRDTLFHCFSLDRGIEIDSKKHGSGMILLYAKVRGAWVINNDALLYSLTNN